MSVGNTEQVPGYAFLRGNGHLQHPTCKAPNKLFMTVTLYDDLGIFLAEARPFLYQNEAVNNLSLGILDSMERQPPRRRNRPTMATVAGNGGEMRLVAMMTPPRKMVLAGEEDAVSASTQLAVYLHQRNKKLPGVFGPEQLAAAFAEAWSGLVERPYRTGTPQGVYKLTEVNDLSLPQGTFRTPYAEELELIADWIFQFEHDIQSDNMPSLTQQIAAQLIQNRDIFVWADESDTPQAMATRSRPTQHGISINRVYTPEASRGHGYATACVAHLSQYLLDQGYTFCTLFTDLTNPISNHVYQKIGYKKVCEFQDFFWE